MNLALKQMSMKAAAPVGVQHGADFSFSPGSVIVLSLGLPHHSARDRNFPATSLQHVGMSVASLLALLGSSSNLSKSSADRRLFAAPLQLLFLKAQFASCTTPGQLVQVFGGPNTSL